MIWVFIASMLFLNWVRIRKNITLLGPFGFFIIYQVIYNVIPWLASALDIYLFSLSREEDLLTTQILLASVCNFAFGSVYLFAWKSTEAPRAPLHNYQINPQVVFWLAFFPTIYIVQHYGWNNFSQIMQDGGTPTLFNSLASYLKFFLIACYIHCLILYRFSRHNIIILCALIIMVFVDGARTNLMMIVAPSIFFLYNGGRLKTNWKIIVGAGAVLMIFVFSRALRLQNDFSTNILDTFLAEGIVGSYMNIQTIYLLKYIPSTPFTYGTNYLIDPIISLTPLASWVRGSLETWITQVSPYLNEPFAPVGGFYYMTEALASFGWAGPPLVTTIFAAINIRLNNRIRKNQNLYLVYLCTFGCLFSKTQFINCFKLFVVLFICYFLIQMLLVPTTSPIQNLKEST